MAELVEKVCPVCGIIYGLERTFYEYRRKGSAAEKDRGWHCPNGHPLIIVEPEADKLRRERDQLKQRLAYKDDCIREAREQAEHERRRANGYKGHATKITKRAKAGVCPCCNRTFQQLARHMATKHPQFTPLDIDQAEGATVQ